MAAAKNSVTAHFDVPQNAWILTTFEDVLAALRTPELIQTDANFRPQHSGLPSNHAALVTDLVLKGFVAHRPVFESMTTQVFMALPDRGTCDLVADFLQPWSTAIFLRAAAASGVDAAINRFIARYGPGNIRGSTSQIERVLAKIAGHLLNRFYPPQEKGAEKSLLLGITQTLPSFLANAWLWLIQHPDERARFRAESSRADLAFEDLLRRAGHVHTLYRRAAASCTVRDTKLTEGDHVVLRMDVANCDSSYLADLDGRAAPHLSLGAGAHPCPGAAAVRMLGLMATAALLQRWSSIELAGVVRWNRGGTLSAPVALPVRVRKM
jgi:cytochrome P450